MNKEQIIESVYERGAMWEGCLMACYSKEIFMRREIFQLVGKYHASMTAVDTTIDILMKKGFVHAISSHSKIKRYTVTTKGESFLSAQYPELRYEMACKLDRHPAQKQPSLDDTYADFIKDCVTDTERAITDRCLSINKMLLDKNRRYGNSSLEPFGLFTNVARESKIEARIDDKLSRMKTYADKNERNAEGYKDAIRDLTGYLILYQIALEKNK